MVQIGLLVMMMLLTLCGGYSIKTQSELLITLYMLAALFYVFATVLYVPSLLHALGYVIEGVMVYLAYRIRSYLVRLHVTQVCLCVLFLIIYIILSCI